MYVVLFSILLFFWSMQSSIRNSLSCGSLIPSINRLQQGITNHCVKVFNCMTRITVVPYSSICVAEAPLCSRSTRSKHVKVDLKNKNYIYFSI